MSAEASNLGYCKAVILKLHELVHSRLVILIHLEFPTRVQVPPLIIHRRQHGLLPMR